MASSSKVVLSGMKFLMGLVFVGWLMIWVVMPTNTYRNGWSPKLRSETASTYFGTQGTNILIYTFPILFIAVLSCFYLHLAKKSSSFAQSGVLSSHLQAWKRPLLLRGPQGIISAIEFTFSLMFLTLLLWSFSTYLVTSFDRITPESAKQDGQQIWMAKLDSAALRLGLIGNLCCAFLFFPVTRMSSLLPLVGLTSEASIKYHVWLGHVVMLLFSAHGLCYIILWAATSELSNMLEWDAIGISIVAGELALISGLFMWVTTFPRIRRKFFELFFYTHQLYIIFLFFFLLHVGIAFFCLILPGVYLFLLDRYLRFLQSRRSVRLISARLLPSDTVELNFSKSSGTSFPPLSTVFIKVPSVSTLQWHPFTISSSSNLEPEKLSIIIKKEGSWTQKLSQILASPLDRLDVSVEGPYGPSSSTFLRYDSLVLVSGGSGITPFIAIIRELIFRSTTLGSKTPSILLVCSFKTTADLMMLDLLLPITGNVSDLSRLQLKVEAFITREKAPSSNSKNIIRTIWFKPIPSDMPVSHVLGPNSWLWLGAVITTSFIAFLVLTGICTRYYIYPIDHNTNEIFSYSKRAMLNLIFIIVSIAATASAAVLWNKKMSSMELKQIQSMDAPTPAVSPSSWFFNADRELESVPHESIVQATNVHFGERPDLKRILLECKEPNTGVMASGPRGLRHHVASVCSSGLADNLHFESISFSW
ncbi:Ferric-chelate reductase (NADH) protein [Dioscorea alata]|uniref:Ferric-chelate reductase (NADH) protein n=2 Tax=Dioscorea alata TaxID=55571 RepID=A0ACB7TZW1_DIOAL|nr:Ferric-chelate reductase (NADH) protein [Dioscorea alata]